MDSPGKEMSASWIQRLPPLAMPFAGLFVLSGAAGLVYQIVWSRLLVHVFGVTAFAVSTVLVSFMGGMALGAALLGRRADAARRPLRMFALLEAGIGTYALLLPLLLRAVDGIYSAVFPALPDSFLLRSSVRFVFCLALLVVPTLLMGATLPALGRGLLHRRGEVGFGIGLLYFVNTLGAAVGCFLAGFWLLPDLGLTRTTLVAATLNAVVASTGLWLDRRSGGNAAPSGAPRPAPRKQEEPTRFLPTRTIPESWPLWVALGSGFAGLAFEVVWFRVLVLVFGSTVYSFSAMLSVFLLGIAVGSLAIGRVADRHPAPVRLLALTQGAIALFGLTGYLAVNSMPVVFLRILWTFGLTFDGMNRTKLLLSLLTLLPPAMAFGATFPVVVRLASGDGTGTGTVVGRVYAWNTVGAIVGSFASGFVLLPLIGTEWTLKLVIAVAILLAFGSLLAEAGPLRPRWAVPSGLAMVAVATLLVVGPRWDRTLLGAGVYFDPQQFYDAKGHPSTAGVTADYELMTFTEGYNDTIISFQSPKGRFITVNGSTTASNHFEDMFSQRMLGHLPMALHPGRVGKACIIGLGAGVTAGAIGLYESDRLVGVELEKGVFVASRFFERENHHLLDNPKLAVRIDDGRSYLKLTGERFDVISSAPNFPSLTGSGALYSKEFFELARARLAPGGIMCQFAPIWRMLPADVKTIVGSFVDVFPHVRVFNTGVSLVMLGRLEPFPPVDLEELTRRVERPEVQASLAEIGVRGPVELLSYYQFDEAEARRWVEGVSRNTDDRPRTEFFAPRAVFEKTVGSNLLEIRRLRPDRTERAARLGIREDYRESYDALAAAQDATTDAEIELHSGRIDRASEILEPVAASGHRYARYLLADLTEGEALTLQRDGKADAALASFLAVLRYEPDRLESLVGAGYLKLFTGDLAGADALLSRAVELYPRSAGAAYRLGAVREVQGRLGDAEELYIGAIRHQPRIALPHALLGALWLGRGRTEDALRELEVARRLGDESEGSMAARAQALLALGRSRDAFGAAEEAAERYPTSEVALRVLARAAEASGRTSDAEQARRRLDALPRTSAPALVPHPAASPGPPLPP